MADGCPDRACRPPPPDPDLEPGDFGYFQAPPPGAGLGAPTPPKKILTNPKPYRAVRVFNRQFGNVIYVEYIQPDSHRPYAYEYYNINRDPSEHNNIYQQEKRTHPNQLTQLHDILIKLEQCHNATACWKAGQPQP